MRKLSVLVKVNKRVNKIYWKEDFLVVETVELPVEGKANKVVLKLVADFLGVKISEVSIKSGLKSKYKVLVVD